VARVAAHAEGEVETEDAVARVVEEKSLEHQSGKVQAGLVVKLRQTATTNLEL